MNNFNQVYIQYEAYSTHEWSFFKWSFVKSTFIPALVFDIFWLVILHVFIVLWDRWPWAVHHQSQVHPGEWCWWTWLGVCWRTVLCRQGWARGRDWPACVQCTTHELYIRGASVMYMFRLYLWNLVVSALRWPTPTSRSTWTSWLSTNWFQGLRKNWSTSSKVHIVYMPSLHSWCPSFANPNASYSPGLSCSSCIGQMLNEFTTVVQQHALCIHIPYSGKCLQVNIHLVYFVDHTWFSKCYLEISITLCLCIRIHSNEGQVSVHDNIVQVLWLSRFGVSFTEARQFAVKNGTGFRYHSHQCSGERGNQHWCGQGSSQHFPVYTEHMKTLLPRKSLD